MGSSRRILRFILKLRTHTSRAGGRSMGDTLRECRPKPQRRRSIHQARSSTLEVRGTGRAQRRQTPGVHTEGFSRHVCASVSGLFSFAYLCGVEVWRGGLGGAYLLPTLSSVGASRAPPCFRFHTPLIEPDVRICRIRLSEKTHAIAEAIACDAVCNF